MQAVVFGAGNIGRGFLGQLLHQSGYEIVFLDVVEEVINKLNTDHSFPIRIVSDNKEEIYTVDNVSAVSSLDLEQVKHVIAGADIMATAVGVNILPRIAPTLAAGLQHRFDSGNLKELNIVICENIIHSGEHVKSLVLNNLDEKYHQLVEDKVGFAAAVVSRMVPVPTAADRAENPVQVKVEPYCILPVDKPAFRGALPEVKGFEYSDNLIAYEERKLFTHNAGHALCAYFGFLKGYTYVYEAVNDQEIHDHALQALMESGQALIKKHRFTEQQHKDHIEDLFSRFANVALGDTVARVGRDPIRKLGYNDRLVGSARIALEFGIEPTALIEGIMAAFKFNPAEDEAALQLQQMLAEQGIDYVLTEVCALTDADQQLRDLIKVAYQSS